MARIDIRAIRIVPILAVRQSGQCISADDPETADLGRRQTAAVDIRTHFFGRRSQLRGGLARAQKFGTVQQFLPELRQARFRLHVFLQRLARCGDIIVPGMPVVVILPAIRGEFFLSAGISSHRSVPDTYILCFAQRLPLHLVQWK